MPGHLRLRPDCSTSGRAPTTTIAPTSSATRAANRATAALTTSPAASWYFAEVAGSIRESPVPCKAGRYGQMCDRKILTTKTQRHQGPRRKAQKGLSVSGDVDPVNLPRHVLQVGQRLTLNAEGQRARLAQSDDRSVATRCQRNRLTPIFPHTTTRFSEESPMCGHTPCRTGLVRADARACSGFRPWQPPTSWDFRTRSEPSSRPLVTAAGGAAVPAAPAVGALAAPSLRRC